MPSPDAGAGGRTVTSDRYMVAVPPGYASSVDIQHVKNVFPYGVCSLDIVEGGGLFSSGIALPGIMKRRMASFAWVLAWAQAQDA